MMMQAACPHPHRPENCAARFFRSREGTAAHRIRDSGDPLFRHASSRPSRPSSAYAGEQLVANAVDKLARQMRTGQITAAITRGAVPTGILQRDFDSHQMLTDRGQHAGEALPGRPNTTTTSRAFRPAYTQNVFRSTCPAQDIRTEILARRPGNGQHGPRLLPLADRDRSCSPFPQRRTPPRRLDADYLMISTSTFKNEKY